MNRQLLLSLNGNRDSGLKRWLDNFKGEPRIAWYPSAGEDFRDLLYLNPEYARMHPGFGPEPAPPDIFLHTDYFPWKSSTFLDKPVQFDDGRTKVTIKHIEELPRCDLPLDEGIVHFPEGSIATGRVVFLQVGISSDLLGEFTAPVLYVFAENGAFCAERILPSNAAFSHIIHVRYGSGFGGSSASGAWLMNVLDRLQCECFITDGHHYWQGGDSRTCELYPPLGGDESNSSSGGSGALPPSGTRYLFSPLDREEHDFGHRNRDVLRRVIRRVRGILWSNHGDVTWYGVHPAR